MTDVVVTLSERRVSIKIYEILQSFLLQDDEIVGRVTLSVAKGLTFNWEEILHPRTSDSE